MKLLTLAEAQEALLSTYAQKAEKYPDHYGQAIPVGPSQAQVLDVQHAIRSLTGCECSSDVTELMRRWDFTHLEIANFGFGFRGTFAERLLEQNRSDAVNAWWEGASDERPATQLFLAQGDPYVLLLDVQSDTVLAYMAGDGSQTAVKIASSLSTCLSMLVTIQLYRLDATGVLLTVDEVKSVLGQDCDDQFWSEEIQHWAQFN